MTYDFLSYLFCCCHHKEEENYDIPAEQDDETTRLIPNSLEPSIYTDPALVNYHRMQQRLGTIVRAKERKMVNVGSHIPFNLYNQVLPKRIDHSFSRDTSTASDFFDSAAGGRSEGMHYRQHSHPSAPYPRFTISASPDPYRDRPHSYSESAERESQTPILNVRLVGFMNRRGRTMRRNQSDVAWDSTESDSTSIVSTVRHHIGGSSTTASPINLRLHEAGAISLSWGD